MTTPDTTNRIRALMERHGWSQTQVADYLGVSQPNVSNWLLPEGNPNRRKPGPTVGRLLDVLETIEFLAPPIHASLMPASKGK